jgi:predicted AAA+ superfamily ATPase
LGGNRHDRSAAHTIEQVLLRGGFPELSAHPEVEVGGFYRSYIATYLERDLRQLLQVTNLRDYERFLRACALRTAQLPGVCDNPGFSSEVIITRKHTRFGESRA